MAFDPVKKAAKWTANLQSAGQSYVDGVNAVQTAPGQLAAAKQDTLKQRFNAAVDSGKWAQNTAAVSLQSWQQSAAKAQGSFTGGAAKGKDKVLKYLTAAAPRYAQNRAEIRNMPNATDADRQARMIRNMQLMQAMKGLGRS